MPHHLPRRAAALSRRRILLAAAGLGAGLAAPALLAQPSARLRIAQSTALTGPLGELGMAAHQGAKACFDAINARGGIHGARIELQVKDDAYDVKRALANVQSFVDDPDVFSLFNCIGTPMVAASLPLLRSSGIPYFAPFTGALLARPKDMRNVINVRASYPEETERLVQHLTTIGVRKIAVAYQNNAFGKEVFTAAENALARHQLTPLASATIENDGSDAAAAAQKLAAAGPEAVLIGLAGKPTIDFIKSMRALRRGLPLYALSVMGSRATLNALGDDALGVTVSQVVPLPTNPVVPVVRDYLEAWKASGTSIEPSHLALEGYINARVFAEALRRAGRNPSRQGFIDAVWNLKRFDLGGYLIHFTEPGSNASRFVELTMISRGGRFIR